MIPAGVQVLFSEITKNKQGDMATAVLSVSFGSLQLSHVPT